MKHILSLSVALLMACVVFAQNITDSYRPGGFDYNGASIKTFSVSDTTAVQFSRGNLQYNAALDKWRFALRQYSTACSDNLNAAEGYDGWIDLFCWGTSGWNSGATAYQPWANAYYTSFYPGGESSNDLTGAYANADWGIYNKIENGGKCKGMWRLLTKEEWEYLIGNNTKRSGKWGACTIAGIYTGVILLPDDYTLPSGCSYTAGWNNLYGTNQYTYAEWEKMQAAGAVFLPAAGQRSGTSLNVAGIQGYYWSSSHHPDYAQAAYIMHIWNTGSLTISDGTRSIAQSVRLVRRMQTPLEGRVWVDMGLPSGTLWYSCNVGTTKPQGYGAYFAWGETKPKADYSWDTYKWGTAENALTKYCNDTSYGLDGYTDSYTRLEQGDDAARSSMGGDVRIPTKSEWQELIDSCYGEYTTYKGAKGWMFTSKTNSNRLFLPAAGLRSGTNSPYAGVEGGYWSSSLCEDFPDHAWLMGFDSDDQVVGLNDRYYGRPVRAVKGGSQTNDALAEAFDANGASIKTFTVAEGRTVHFSKGNLWYNAAANLWRFAPEQYEYIGADNSNISETYNGYIDLFGWGTSGWNSGANDYQPWATSDMDEDYYVGGSGTNSLTGAYANSDWGVYNAISNGGNQAGMWRTMTSDEWEYLINTRTASTVGGIENARYAKATVGGVTGLIILPDSFTLPTEVGNVVDINNEDVDYTGNIYSTEQWTAMETAGAVFLPAAGRRYGTEVGSVGSGGYYWSSTCNDGSSAWGLEFYDDGLDVDYGARYYGRSVRLVKD